MIQNLIDVQSRFDIKVQPWGISNISELDMLIHRADMWGPAVENITAEDLLIIPGKSTVVLEFDRYRMTYQDYWAPIVVHKDNIRIIANTVESAMVLAVEWIAVHPEYYAVTPDEPTLEAFKEQKHAEYLKSFE